MNFVLFNAKGLSADAIMKYTYSRYPKNSRLIVIGDIVPPNIDDKEIMVFPSISTPVDRIIFNGEGVVHGTGNPLMLKPDSLIYINIIRDSSDDRLTEIPLLILKGYSCVAVIDSDRADEALELLVKSFPLDTRDRLKEMLNDFCVFVNGQDLEKMAYTL